VRKPLLVIEVGNSRLKVGLFDRDEISGDKLPVCREFLVQDVSLTMPMEFVETWLTEHSEPVPAIVTGSFPEGVEKLCRSWSSSAVARPAVLSDRAMLPIESNVTSPERVGIDRLLGAVAVNRLRRPGQAVVVVDSGTATTINLIDEEGVFQGGAILPGLRLSARALHEYTQLLPDIPLEEIEAESREPVGKETREAIRSGLFWGQIGAIRELTAGCSAGRADPLLVLSGGGGALMRGVLSEFQFYPHLSLQGFATVWESVLKNP
jgi:type III pantothenate kinase